nr:gustatory receptor for sugar taste 64e-like [Maniola hyperantus]
MHACLRQPMRLCRWAGVFPVEGLNKKTCSDLSWDNDTEDLNLMERFFTLIASFVFELTSYSHWKAVLFEVANVQSTFLWNFTDAMTMCVSLYLTSYFRVLNKLIEHQQRLKITRWEEIRLHYSDLVQLVRVVDSKMCYLILLSFFTNVFFICSQVFSLLKSFKSVEYYIYYYYSSIFLFVRATMTSLLAANVNTVAMEPFYILQHVPTSDYTIEVQRFIRQTKYTTTALSGLFFDVTRGMILTVIGTIMKYELVLLQFSVKSYEAIN